MSNVKKLEFAEGTDVGAPTDLGIQSSTTSINEYPDDAAFVSANGSAEDGDTYLNTTTEKIRYYVGGAWRNAIPESDAADATKKVEFDLTGATTGTTATIDINNTASRTYTMQDETGTIPVLPIDMASEVSGALPIANGGTGQTGATAAFDALAPTTTTGDLIYHDGTDNVRLPVGTEGQQLKVVSGSPAWGDAGGGSGEKTYITNPSAASAITGWSQVGDLDVARTTTASELPREYTTASGIKITADANTQSVADYVYYDFTLDDVDLNKKLKIQWSQKQTGSYVAGDLAVVITTQADRTTALHTPVTTAIPAADGEFITSFDSGSTAALSLVIRATTDMATDAGIVISDVIVGPGVITQGAVVGPTVTIPVPFIAATTNPVKGATSTDKFSYYRDGEWLNATFEYEQTSAGTAAVGAIRIALPAGLTINATALSGISTGISKVGNGYIYNGSANTEFPLIIAAAGGQSRVNLYFQSDADSVLSLQPAQLSFNNTSISASGSFRVPIAEWAGSGTFVGQNNVEYAYVTGWDTDTGNTTTTYGPGGAAMGGALSGHRTKTVTWQTPIQVGDEIRLEVSRDQISWSPLQTGALVGGNLMMTSVSSTGNGDSGVFWENPSTTTSRVYFRRYLSMANDDSPTTDWPSSNAFWRFVKVSGGIAVGFGAATATSLGLVSGGTVPGSTSGTSIAAGYVGESLTASAGTTFIGTTETDLVSLTLTTGVWLVSATSFSDGNTGVIGSQAKLYVKGSNSNIRAVDSLSAYDDGATGVRMATSLTFAPRVVVIASGDANKNILVRSYTVAGTGGFSGYISAARIG